MHTSFASLLLIAALGGGCVTVAPPPNRSASDPSDASAPEASSPPFRPNLVATTQVYLDPAVGQGAQKMDHSKMPGMESKQPPSTTPAPQSQQAQEMDHSKMPGMEPKQPPTTTSSPPSQQMPEMDHSKMPGMESKPPPASPPNKEALKTEMQKTSDEMKKLSDEMKAKTDAAKPAEKSSGSWTVPQPSPEAAIYTCPMHPGVKQPAPGKCPKCGMTLVKKSAAP